MTNRWWTLGLVGSMAVWSAACGGSETGSGGNAGEGGTGGSAGEGGSGGAGTMDGTGGSGACSVANPCSQGTCVFEQGSCDPSAVGTCSAGFTCDGPPSGPVCQCDGTVLEGATAECDVWSKGEPYADPEVCAQGTFNCGGQQCTRNAQVCVIDYPPFPDVPETYSCEGLADIQNWCAHGIPDCSCIETDPTKFPAVYKITCQTVDDHQEIVSIYRY